MGNFSSRKAACITILAGCLCSAAAEGAVGNYYADINRELLVVPRSSAMAGADITFFRGSSPLSNPANLANDSVKEASLTYASYLQNTFSTCGVSFLGPIDSRSSFGISMGYVLIPDIKITDAANPFVYPSRTETSSDLFFRAGYGRKVVSFNDRIHLQAGIAINAERRNLIDWTGYGIGTDFGADVVFSDYDAVLGVVVENITGSYTHWSSNYKEFSYPHMRVGLGWQPEFSYIYGKLTACFLSSDLLTNEGMNSFVDDSMQVSSDTYENSLRHTTPYFKRIYTNPLMLFSGRYGVEYTIMNTVAFRIGYNASIMNFTFGGGLNLLQNRAGIDFAYLSNELAPTYKICMNFRWR
jgi:hypothetical protein